MQIFHCLEFLHIKLIDVILISIRLSNPNRAYYDHLFLLYQNMLILVQIIPHHNIHVQIRIVKLFCI